MRTPEIDESLLTLEDVAMLVSCESQLPSATVERLRPVVRTDPRFEPHVQRLEALADEAGLPERKCRLHDGFEFHREFERLEAAWRGPAEDWRHPAEILDPKGELGVCYAELVHIAETRARQAGEPGRYRSVLARLEQAWSEEKARDALLESFVEGLIGCESEEAERLLRLAASEYRRRREA